MQRFTGQALLAVGVLHTLVGLLSFGQPLAAIARDGVVNAVDPRPERQTACWFLLAGVLLCTLGYSTRWAQRRTGTVPAGLGWILLAIAGSGVVLMPFSGFWLLFPPALLALAAARRGPARPDPGRRADDLAAVGGHR